MSFQVLPRGARIGPFTVESVLGGGGQAIVYRVRDAGGGEAALKVLRPDALGDERDVARFWREARALAAIDHPNVAPIRFVGDTGERPFIAMDLLPGGSLAEKLKREGRLPWREAVARGAEVARGLAALHAAGLVHRDVKPQNVLLAADGSARLADLGLARSESELPLTLPGEVMGTPEYMAPEQIRDATSVDAAADLYALGATVYALLTGDPPFGGRAGLGLLRRQLEETPRAPRSLEPSVPPGLDALVLRLLAKEPRARGESAAAVARELGALVGAKDAAPPRRRGLLAACAAAGAVAVAALLIRGTSREGPPPGAPETAPVLSRQPETAGPRASSVLEPLAPLGVVERPRFAGPAEVHAVALSPDDELLLSGDEMGALVLWDARTGERRARVGVCKGVVRAIAWSPSGARVAIGADNGLYLWDRVAAPRRLPRVNRPSAIAFAGEERLLVVSRHATVDSVDLATGAVTNLSPFDRGLDVVSVAARADAVLVGTKDGEVRLLEAPAGRFATVVARERAPGDDRAPVHTPGALAFSPDGRFFAIARDATVEVRRRAAPDVVVASEPLSDPAVGLAFSPSGERLAVGLRGRDFVLWSLGTPIGVEDGRRTREVRALAFSRDGARLFVGCFDGTIRAVDTATGAVLIAPRSAGVGALAAAGGVTVRGRDDGGVILRDGPRETAFVASESVLAVAFARPDVYAATRDGAVHVWRASGSAWRASATRWNPTQVDRYAVEAAPCLRSAAFAPDARSVFLWDGHGSRAILASGRERESVGSLHPAVWGSAFASDTVVCTDRDGLSLLRPPGPDVVAVKHKRWTAVAWAARSSEVIAGDEDGFVWRGPLTTESVDEDRLATEHWVTAVAASRDGAWVASASATGVVRLWTGRPRLVEADRWSLDAGEVAISLAFADDGTLLAGTTDGVVRRFALRGAGR